MLEAYSLLRRAWQRQQTNATRARELDAKGLGIDASAHRTWVARSRRITWMPYHQSTSRLSETFRTQPSSMQLPPLQEPLVKVVDVSIK